MFIYSRFEDLRKEKGISKSFVAEKLGRLRSLCVDWKAGKSTPNDEQIKIVAELLDTTPAYLTGESDEKKPATETGSGVDDSLVKMLMDLTPSEIEKVRAFVAGLKANRA